VFISGIDGLEGSANAVVGPREIPPTGAPFLASVSGFGNLAGSLFGWKAVVVLPDPPRRLPVVLRAKSWLMVFEESDFADIRKERELVLQLEENGDLASGLLANGKLKKRLNLRCGG
jgi:hypothetical protein